MVETADEHPPEPEVSAENKITGAMREFLCYKPVIMPIVLIVGWFVLVITVVCVVL